MYIFIYHNVAVLRPKLPVISFYFDIFLRKGLNGSSVPAGEPGPPGPMGSLFIIPLNLGVGSSSFARAATFRDLLQKHLVSFF